MADIQTGESGWCVGQFIASYEDSRQSEGLLNLPEYPEYPVSLGEQSAVHHREAQPHSEPLEGAAGHAGLGEEEEGVKEAEEDPSEEDVAQLPPCHYAVLVIGNLYL